jgi:hypothetical protein
MSLIGLVVVLVILGVALYVVETYLPMAPPIKLLIRIIVIAVLILWLLQLFGITGPSVPRLH